MAETTPPAQVTHPLVAELFELFKKRFNSDKQTLILTQMFIKMFEDQGIYRMKCPECNELSLALDVYEDGLTGAEVDARGNNLDCPICMKRSRQDLWETIDEIDKISVYN